MLIGREPEQQQITALVAGARVRQSGVLVISGEAGIGKTALLEDTVARAGEMRVLRTSGSEHESGLSFSGLHQLVGPALHLLEHIPTPQRDALGVALMLRDGPAPERFAVGVATLSLLSRFAEEAPLLLVVDDAHLLDLPSAETIRFVAHRLVADPIALVISLRPEPDAMLHNADLPTVELVGLDLAAASALLATTSDRAVTEDLALRLHRATAGNPLALVELSHDLDRYGLVSPEVPLPVPERVTRAFTQRVSALSPDAQCALLVAVVADGDLAVTSRAVDTLGGAVATLADAEAIELLQIRDGKAVFRHPLVRSAVYAAADPHRRRAAHLAVANALPEPAEDRRAWHLGAAALGPEDMVADRLAGVADRARARGAHGVAALAMVRSAKLSSEHSVRSTRLFRAAESAWLAGQGPRADALLGQAAELTSDPAALAEIGHLRGNVALRSGSLRAAHQLLTRAATRTEPFDPDATALRLADAVTACFYLCDTGAGTAAADQLESLLGHCRSESARLRGQMAVGMARVLAGGAGVHWIRAAVESISEEPRLANDPHRPDWAVIGTLFLRESGFGRSLIRDVVQERRTRTAIGALPNLLFHTARDDATTDRWSSALTGFDESIILARETGQTTDLATSLAGLAWLQARMGRSDECRRNADEAMALAERHHIVLAKIWALFALGDARLSAGDVDSAATRYADLLALLRDIGFLDVDMAPGPELAESQLHRGDEAAAIETAHDYLRRAHDKGQPWALARAYRAVALTSADAGERSSHFERAIELHANSLDLYEEARTRLAFGAALRRAKSRVAARPQLRLALEQFERLGARPWADLAAGELDATGERARRSGEGYAAVLTPQEIRIAQMLGQGSTTKEAAAALFLSPKTVEYHLRHVYQKLGIRSRQELSTVMAARNPDTRRSK